jgi:hypothetical protein
MAHHHSSTTLRIASPAALALVLGLGADLAAQTTVTIPCMRDNTLIENATGAYGNGANPGLFVGVVGTGTKRRALLRFDVAANVPAGARILSAALTVNVSRTTYGGNLDVKGHRVLQDWGEGTSSGAGGGGGGAPATPGDATWLHTFWPTGFWNAPGGDFDSAPSLAITTPSLGLCSSTSSAQSIADVQGWLDAPSQNFGWLLKTNEALAFVSRRLDSREQTLGVPPTLQVTYIAQGQSAPWGQGCPVNGSPYVYTMVGAPIGGTTVQLTHGNGPANNLAANLVALGWDPVGFPLLPQCSLYLPLGPGIITHSLVFLDNAGAGATPVNLPAGFPGVPLVWQAAAISPGPTGYVLSNAVIAQLQ